MALAEGQTQITGTNRDLLMGEGTRFDLQDEFNPFIRQVRADQTGPRPHAHGSYSGTEWQSEAVVPIRVIASGADGDVPSTRAAIMDWSALFHGVGDSGEIAEMRFRLDGDPEEFLMFGRPRGSEPDMSTIGHGYAYASGAFVAQDPRIYSAALTTTSIGLPEQSGGLTLPFTVPFQVTGKLTGGRAVLTNSGTAPAPVTFRIDGPVAEPRIVLTGPDGVQQIIDFGLTLRSGQWLDIDTTKHTALLNGLESANQRGRAEWTMRTHPLSPGDTTLRFFASEFKASAKLTAEHRSAHW